MPGASGRKKKQRPNWNRQRRLHKAFLRYHDASNWPMIREALKRMGRADLIGNGKRHLVPTWQPAGTGEPGKKPIPTNAKRRTAKKKAIKNKKLGRKNTKSR